MPRWHGWSATRRPAPKWSISNGRKPNPPRSARSTATPGTRDRLTDFTRPRKIKPLTEAAVKQYTAPAHEDAPLPEIAARITEKAKTDLGRAKAIYEWIVETDDCAVRNSYAAGALGGAGEAKPASCDRLNTLYVDLARVSGLPARTIHGLRLAPSQFGYQSLGAAPENLRSTAARKSGWKAMAGSRSIPPTCAGLCVWSRQVIWR